MPRRKPRNKGGRPCRYTPFVVASITAALTQGKSIEDAAEAAVIGTSTLYRWLALSRAGDPRFLMLADAVSQARRAGWNGRLVGHIGMTLLKAGF
jgi:hypothetical protein